MIQDPQYHELAFYTLSHSDKRFIHQHLVDAYSAQMATENTKPITILFALAGLYLFVEKNYSGKQVQQAHIQMAKAYKAPIVIALPAYRGNITIDNVLVTAPGEARDAMIEAWCKSVWAAFATEQATVIAVTNKLLGIDV